MADRNPIKTAMLTSRRSRPAGAVGQSSYTETAPLSRGDIHAVVSQFEFPWISVLPIPR